MAASATLTIEAPATRGTGAPRPVGSGTRERPDGFASIVIGALGGLAAGVAFGFEAGNPGPGIALASRLGIVIPWLALVGGQASISVPARLLIASVGSVLGVLALSPVVERLLWTLGSSA